MSGVPIVPAGNPSAYSGDSDLDWWYTPYAAELDATGVPTNQLAGSIVSKTLTAGPGRINFTSSPLGAGRLDLSGALLKALIGSSSAPLKSTNNFPPGHLPSENLDPQLVSFTSMSGGQLKGNISAASLASTPVPAALVGTTTVEQYTSANTMLDLIVSGAHAFGGLITVVIPTQPDQSDTNAPVAGAGAPYKFTVNSSHVVTGCRDKNNVVVSLALGLNAAAYSAYFTFATDRVIAKSLPQIVVEQPPGTNLTDGTSTVSYENVFLDAPVTLGFMIRNPGGSDLTGLGVTFDGLNAADFSIATNPVSPVIAHGSTTFTVRFAPAASGVKTAALHIASNVTGTYNPFDVALTGRAIDPNADDDGDGLSNREEINLAPLGFDFQVANSSLITLLRSNGFYRIGDMQNLALGNPVLTKDPITENFRLSIGVDQSLNFTNWTALTNFTSTSSPTNGRINLTFPPGASNVQFYRLLGTKP